MVARADSRKGEHNRATRGSQSSIERGYRETAVDGVELTVRINVTAGGSPIKQHNPKEGLIADPDMGHVGCVLPSDQSSLLA